ncbi:MAG: bifunctional riboflavin kinase/FAD synthetase [Actinomycetaceae bacterium]|nr:bifunctional riboflavin kinase/FAD synthetase [Actinomycetaceae bacterium]
MQVWRTLDEACAQKCPSALTIGIFDGLHRGHQEILSTLVKMAKAKSLRSVALTFDPHPVTVHYPQADFNLIYSLEDRLTYLSSMGVDATFVQAYSLDFAQADPQDFVKQYFVDCLGARLVVIGDDVRFGKGNSGDLALLRELGGLHDFEVVAVPDICDDLGRRLSSSWVRELLAEGDVDQVHDILGRPHRVRGLVVHGLKRGRELGFPTANLDAENAGEVPADGVYAGWLVRPLPHGAAVPTSIERLPAAISVGTNPQFFGKSRTVEAHVLGRSDLNLYGDSVAIEFVHRIRGMMSFASVNQLLERMDEDLLETSRVLGVPVASRVDPASVTAR